MSRAEKIKRLREVVREITEKESMLDNAIARGMPDKSIVRLHFMIQTLEAEKVRLERSLEMWGSC